MGRRKLNEVKWGKLQDIAAIRGCNAPVSVL